MEKLNLAGEQFDSRLIIGTGKFASAKELYDACKISEAQIATVAVKRIDFKDGTDDIIKPLKELKIKLMPNTSGARNAKEAVFAARLAREALGTNWIKVEVHPDQKYLLPDPVETFEACKILCEDGFAVFAYIPADPVLCRRLEEVGVAAVMPLGSPIGSARGLETLPFIKIIINESKVPVIVDAGIGAPSEAARALEEGASAVMVNTAIAASGNAAAMAQAFKLSCQAGRTAYEAGLVSVLDSAQATSPMEEFLKEAMA